MMTPSRRSTAVRRAVDWLVLRPFPPEFRDRFGRQVVEALWLRVAEARRRGRWSAWRCAGLSAVDLVKAGLGERRDAGRQYRPRSGWGTGLWGESKAVLRGIRRRPLSAGTIVATLGLGIAAVTTSGGWAWGLLLHPIAGVTEQESLVAIETTTREGDFIDASYLDYGDLAQAPSLAGAIAFRDEPLALRLDNLTLRVWSQQVSTNYFELLGVEPALGRFFGPSERRAGPGGAPVVVISHGLWRRVFGSDPSVLGRSVILNRRPYTIIGVAPATFVGTTVGLRFDLWVPVLERGTLEGGYLEWHTDRGSRPLHIVGRRRADVTLEEARSDIAILGTRLQHDFPRTNLGISYTVLPVAHAPYGAQSVLGGLLWSLVAAAGLVALIVIANVSNLLLAGETTRRRDAAIRIALGASQWRITRQVVLQAGFLACSGALVSILVSPHLNGLLAALLPVTQYQVALPSPPIEFVMVLSGGIALLSGLLLGVLPLLGRGRLAVTDALRDGGLRIAGARHRVRGGLAVAEVTLAFLAASGAGLLMSNYHRLTRHDPGFESSGIILASLDTRGSDYDSQSGPLAIERTLEALRAVPGVSGVAAAEQVPLGFGRGSWEPVAIEGHAPAADENMRVEHNTVTPGYFDLMGMPPAAGREFTANDRQGATELGLIVNHAFVTRWLEGREPLGTRVRIRGNDHVIVGVVPNIKLRRLDEDPFPYMYFALAQDYRPNMSLSLHVRTPGSVPGVIATVQSTLRSVAPGLAVTLVMPFADYAAASTFAERAGAVIMGSLSSVAVLLAALGLYALMNVVVSERTVEFGVRSALGASRARLLALVIGRGMRTTVVGLLVGAGLLTVAAGRIGDALGTAIPSVGLIGGAAAGVLGIAALIAVVAPALRASRVHPLVAIRSE